MALDKVPTRKLAAQWTPTLTIITNIAVLTLDRAFFSVNGNFVQCFISATVDPTASAAWDFRASLPFGIVVAAAEDIIGTAAALQSGGFGGTVSGHVASNQAFIEGQHDAAASLVCCHFGYLVP